jgi:hypothetical protein
MPYSSSGSYSGSSAEGSPGREADAEEGGGGESTSSLAVPETPGGNGRLAAVRDGPAS